LKEKKNLFPFWADKKKKISFPLCNFSSLSLSSSHSFHKPPPQANQMVITLCLSLSTVWISCALFAAFDIEGFLEINHELSFFHE